jgi:hypothetical protein
MCHCYIEYPKYMFLCDWALQFSSLEKEVIEIIPVTWPMICICGLVWNLDVTGWLSPTLFLPSISTNKGDIFFSLDVAK